MKALYTAHAHATGGREGSAATDDAKVDVKLSTPKELGGGGGDAGQGHDRFPCVLPDERIARMIRS